MTRDLDVVTARRQVVEAARAMLAGTLSFIEGARRISDLRWFVDLPEFDPDMIRFVAIDSETDTLPLGDVTGWAACQSLIARFSGNTQPPVSTGQG